MSSDLTNSFLDAIDSVRLGDSARPRGLLEQPGNGVLTVEEQSRRYYASITNNEPENYVEGPNDSTQSNDPINQPDAARRRIDAVSRTDGYGDLSRMAQKAYRGINYGGFGSPIPRNKDQYGLTFFTRPRLNLSQNNISRHRKFAQLLTTVERSNSAAVRSWLDHRDRWYTPLVDPLNPWMTILTNNLISISGWQDPVVDTYTSNPGLRKEEWSMADGSYKVYQTFDMTATFKNIVGDPITLLFDLWCEYQTLVYEGWFMPDKTSIVDNEIDYQTRIYRLVLDPTRTYVEKIAATGAAFPLSVPMGTHFDYTNEVPTIDENDQISIPFRCIGAEYMDPILIREFNETLMRWNKDMWEDRRELKYRKLTRGERSLFKYQGYPIINKDTHEFEIWVRHSDYNQVMSGTDPETLRNSNEQ